MTLTPAQEWWTPAQIAESGLPDLPKTRQGVDALADRLNWRGATKFARRRAGKGGGWEYSWKLFPNAAQRALIKQAVAPKAAAAKARDEVWRTHLDHLDEGHAEVEVGSVAQPQGA